MDEDFDDDGIKKMRSQILNAFFKCYGYSLNTSDYDGNTGYTSLRLLIKVTLSRENYKGIPKDNWFIDLFNKDFTNQQQSKLATIHDFLNTYQLEPFRIVKGKQVFIKEEPVLNNQTFEGAKIIDNDFKNEIEVLANPPSFTDFYLAKRENNCQWYGVVAGWDGKRESYHIARNMIDTCFIKEEIISLVIFGVGGTGKSSYLRRLAIDSISADFITLWISDYGDFYDDLLEIGRHPHQKFLVFLEDWSDIKGLDLAKLLLNRVITLPNIRLVIADRDVIGREYSKYVAKSTKIKLAAAENRNIINNVLSFHGKWEEAANKILINEQIYEQPLFIILFILARNAEGDNSSNSSVLYSKIQDIIDYDLKKIFSLCPSIVRALYYWSCFYKIFNNLIIPWEIILRIANYYDSEKATTNLLFYNKNNPIFDILSYYISFREIIRSPNGHRYMVDFHHNVLIETFSNPIDASWYFDCDIMLEIIKALVNNDLHPNKVLYNLRPDYIKSLLSHEEPNIEYPIPGQNHKTIEGELKNSFYGISKIVQREIYIIKIYSHMEHYKTEDDWKRILKNLIGLFFDNLNVFEIIFPTLIELGCKSLFIDRAKFLFENGERFEIMVDDEFYEPDFFEANQHHLFIID